MPQPDPRPLTWANFNDFTPGIADRDFRASGAIGPWPLGTAVANETFACRALPNGALGPLPQRDTTFALALPGDLESGQKVEVVGFLIQGPVRSTAVSTTGYDEANWMVATEYLHTTHDASYRQFHIYRIRMWLSGMTADTIVSASDAYVTGVHRTCFMESFRAAASDATIVGVPMVAYAWWGDGATGIWGVFPDPSTPTSLTPKSITTAYLPGPQITYQGRSIIFHRQDYSNGDATIQWRTNEQIFFTNTNLATLASAVASTFSPEDPGEITAVAVSAQNELFVLKRRHGAFVIRGDINEPVSLRVPGLMGTGKTQGTQPITTPLGVVYFSLGSGIYVWAGGEDSICISDQLEPSNFDYSLFPAWADSHNGGRPDFYQDLIFVPPYFVYDLAHHSWWRLEDPADTSAPSGYLYFQKSISKNAIIAVRGEYDATAPNYAFAYNFDKGQFAYQWKSHPIPTSIDHDIDVREVAIRATGISGSTVAITVSSRGNSQTETFTLTGSNYPRLLRANMYVQGNDVQVKIVANSNDASSAAPIVYSVGVGYYETQPVPANT